MVQRTELPRSRRGLLFLFCLTFLVGQLRFSQAGQFAWWSLGLQSCAINTNDCQNCQSTDVLNDNQTSLCKSNGGTQLIRAISRGTRSAIIDCKHQFQNSKWNCATFQGDHLFGRFVDNNTRETAVLNAYMSAGAAHGIATACHENVIDGCRCKTSETYVDEEGTRFLQACGEDIEFAIDFLRSFTGLGVGEVLNHLVDIVNRWNNEIGYASLNTRTNFCRCTGISGSCTVQTCYLKAPSVEQVGTHLRQKYNGAVKVVLDQEGQLQTSTGSPDNDTTVYINDSQDLCNRNDQLGILGTKGRLCDRDSSNADGCFNMCCRRGYNTTVYDVDIEECAFEWCCEIKCTKTGRKTVTEYRCL